MTPPGSALTVRLAVAVALVQSLLVWAFLGYLGYRGGGWRVIGYVALYALAFTGLTWALIARRRWVRAPLIVVQLMLAASGLGLLQGGFVAVGVGLTALAVTGVGLLLAPGTRQALGVTPLR